ncbi:hypothetical protein, partial [Escherichia coli]|uniref:hypothetical protein n=1 Tax=Escherichia coli TaxID=562 RepID=UPI0021C73B67
ADRNRSHWSTSKTPSYTKSVSWQHHLKALAFQLLATFNIYKLTSGCARDYVSECIVVLVV